MYLSTCNQSLQQTDLHTLAHMNSVTTALEQHVSWKQLTISGATLQRQANMYAPLKKKHVYKDTFFSFRIPKSCYGTAEGEKNRQLFHQE